MMRLLMMMALLLLQHMRLSAGEAQPTAPQVAYCSQDKANPQQGLNAVCFT
jgi:hypothetical protein